MVKLLIGHKGTGKTKQMIGILPMSRLNIVTGVSFLSIRMRG